MRTSLADSLAYIADAARSQLGISPDDADAVIFEIRRHRVRPGVFGRYYKLVLALQSQAFAEAGALFRDLGRVANVTPTFQVVPFSEPGLGPDKALYSDLIDPNSIAAPLMSQPSPGQWNGFPGKVSIAFDVIKRADPSLGAELQNIVIEVVGAAPSVDENARSFGSASSFMLWGALMMNLDRHTSIPDIVEGLVHEAAHQLLFAHSITGPLVTNAIEERYSSPLRPDPRPMDGVFHATFVTARICYALDRIRAATTRDFSPVALAELEERLEQNRRSFFAGMETIEKYAQLTPDGQRIIEESCDYMKGN